MFAPFEQVIDGIVQILPWVGAGVIVSEVLFIGGLLVIASSIGLKIKNPLKLRKEFIEILSACTGTKVFWLGFWMNAVGAVGTGVLLIAGIVIALPASSWGIAIMPLVDLLATIALRRLIRQAYSRGRVLP